MILNFSVTEENVEFTRLTPTVKIAASDNSLVKRASR